jgi:hypothetical protein
MPKGSADAKQKVIWAKMKHELVIQAKKLHLATAEFKKAIEKGEALAKKEAAADKNLAALIKKNGVKYKLESR